MKPFFFRLATLSLRFSIPLVILTYLTTDELGKYYLFTVTATTIIFFISLEIGIPSSKKYLRSWHHHLQQSVFSSLLYTQMKLGFLFAIPVMLVFGVYLHLSIAMGVVCILYLVTEACVNESGRFFWNIGEVSTASSRDFFRALFFAISLGAGVYAEEKAISVTALGLLSFFNTLIILQEQVKWGHRLTFKCVQLHNVSRTLKKNMLRTYRMVYSAVPQTAHLQVLGLQPLLERWFIERSVSLEMVGLYSFQFSLVQAGFSLLLLPFIADLRRAILSTTAMKNKEKVFQKARVFALRCLSVGLLCAVGAYISLPLLNIILSKNLEAHVGIAVVVWLSASSLVFTGAVSPLYAPKERIFTANIFTLLAMAPLAAGMVYSTIYGSMPQMVVFVTLAASAILQMLVRSSFFLKKTHE